MPHRPSACMLPRYRTTRCSKSAWQVVTGSMPPSLTNISPNGKQVIVNLAIVAVDIWLKQPQLLPFHIFSPSKCLATRTPTMRTHLHLHQLSALAFRQDHGAGKVIGLHCIAEHHLQPHGTEDGTNRWFSKESQTESSFVAKMFSPILSPTDVLRKTYQVSPN